MEIKSNTDYVIYFKCGEIYTCGKEVLSYYMNKFSELIDKVVEK